ncbi:hypothetical protein DPMN_030965 [Dreissena polymorpha]|uniref:Myb/SANT-like DNA-binding domain-containing protein n=2 Tax=Dreissena polymorpha TaxID=45954 RepID=A0A9D4M1P9_DREPO|nr:hypothetical protein DPMN_091647 [Dreissena polymorpha]KAH3867828.1 hypothetical protein DPMN_030965 [Dreissena polymorpha]
MWAEIAEMFSANTTGPHRTADQLEKKWENNVSKHRGIYNDHQRLLSLTGSAPFQSKYDIITESVMAVVGKESAAVQGVAPFTLDTTFIQLTDTSQATTVEPPSPAPPQQCDNRAVKRRLDTNGEHAVSAVKPATTCCSHCSLNELNVLKKRKMELQIRLYKAQLARLGEE